MLTLALESSAKPASAAVCSDGEMLGQYFQNNGLTHSRTILSMAESLLKNLDITMADIGLIAVSRGPGSFTGVRIGVSAAKGLAWGLGIPVCGVSTLEAMAYQIKAPGFASTLENTGCQGGNVFDSGLLLCPVMDARRGQVYNALFKTSGGKPVRLCDDRAISLKSLSVILKGLDTQCLLIGDGSALCYEYLNNDGICCRVAPGLMRWQTAYGVASASAFNDPVPASELEPCYLRPSQAERERSGTHNLSE